MVNLDWTWILSNWILLLLAAGVLLYFWGTNTYGRFTRRDIPHLKPLPFIGSMGPSVLKNESLFDLMLGWYEKFKGRPYGVVFMFRQPVVLLTDPELIKAVAMKDFDYFTDHRTVYMESKEKVWSKGLIMLKGQRWKDMRSILSPAFTSSKMKIMFVLVSDCCQQLVDFLEQCYQQPQENNCAIKKEGELLILEMKDLFTRSTNDVIASTAFGICVDSLKHPKNEFYVLGQEATNFGSYKWFLFLAIPQVMKLLGINLVPGKITNFFRTLVTDTIATREREGIVRPDMLHLLMQAKKGTLHDENSEENHKGNTKTQLDDEDIIAQALLFFLGGFDTTSTLMSFVSHQLAVYPEIQSRLQEEIDETLQKHDGKFTYEAVHSMKYLDMVVSETLRLYPPGSAVERVCTRNYTLKSDPPLELHIGDNIFIPLLAVHRDPKYYPDPERFDPERFSDENKHNINASTYMPFGIGPRSCIGNRFALMEVKTVLVHLLSQFSLRVVAKTPMPIKLTQRGFNISAEGGFWMGLQKRNT